MHTQGHVHLQLQHACTLVRAQIAETKHTRLARACRLAVLVDASASIEDAVAHLLGTRDMQLRHLACLAYVRRLYSPFLLDKPETVNVSVMAFRWLFEGALCDGAHILAQYACMHAGVSNGRMLTQAQTCVYLLRNKSFSQIARLVSKVLHVLT